MIPIEFRMDQDEQYEYIDKVLSCLSDNEKKKCCKAIKKLLKQIPFKGEMGLLKKALKNSMRNYYNVSHSKWTALSMWIVLPYEDLLKIKAWIEKKVQVEIESLNAGISCKGIRIHKIKSYHDLLGRRQKTYKDSTIAKYVAQGLWYDTVYESFKQFIEIYNKRFSTEGIGCWIVEKTGMKVCPYCNIMYTYNRGKKVTAQLDHFFPKSEYPMFALCFYNLIPSCPACNHLKLDGVEKLVSPYSEDAFKDWKITWEYDGNLKKKSLKALEDMIKIKIQPSKEDEDKKNICKLKLEEAYQQHVDYASEILKKLQIYTNSDAKKLICSVSAKIGITPDEVERFYFGNYLEESELKKRPLSKLTKDFYEKY